MRAFTTALLLCATAALADDPQGLTWAEGTGQAAVVGGDEARAFEEAKKNAIRAAVERVAGVVLSADTATRNGQLVMDRVTARSEGYVRQVELKGRKVEKGVVTVDVNAQVGTRALEKDLVAIRGIVDRLGRSRLLVVLQENAIDDKGVASKSEVVATELTQVFKKDGWTIIDEKGTGEDRLTVSSGVAVGKLDPKEISKRSDADYIIYGSVNIRYVPPVGGGIADTDAKGNQLIFIVTADYDLAMFETRTGRQLAKTAGKFDQSKLRGPVNPITSYSRTAIDFSRAEAPRLIAELRGQAIEALRAQDVDGAAVTMEVSNVPDLDTVDDLEKALATVEGVQRVRMAGDFKDGKVEFEVGFLGTSRELGKAVSRSTFKRKKLVVKAVMNNRIEVALAR